MSNRLLVRGARQLLTLRGGPEARRGPALRELGLIRNGALLVQDGRIAAVGPARQVERLAAARGAKEIDAGGCVVLPGFVDSHTHLVHGPARLWDYEARLEGQTYEQIAAAGGGILSTMRAVRTTPAARLQAMARESMNQMARHGTTTVEGKSGYGLNETAEFKVLRVTAALGAVPTFLGAHVTPPEFAGRSDEYIDWLIADLMPKVARRKLARFADVYCDSGAVSVAQARRYLLAARALGFGLRMHASQFANLGAVQLAVELGAMSADHLEVIGEAEIDALANSSVIGTLLPGSVFHLGLTSYAPARRLIEAGAAIALATDFNPGTSPTPSMPMVLSLACTQMRMTPAEAISAATINGAHALGLAEETGSLEVGKHADFAVLAISDYRELPYSFGVNPVKVTVRRGSVQIH